ncbi:hypothetical protein BH23BAC1_BH23BAC1_24270 [soil metagenome]
MKNLNVFAALFCLILFGCQSNAPKEQATTPDPNPGFAVFEGAEIDMMKKSVKAYEEGDFQTYKSFFADTARAAVNVWPFSSGNFDKTISIDSVISNFKFSREKLYTDIKIGDDSIYEVIGGNYSEKGELMHSHMWLNWSGKDRTTGKIVEFPVFVAGGIQNGKFVYLWMIYDQPAPPQASPVKATAKK